MSQLLAAPNYPKLRESDEQESQYRERLSTRNTGGGEEGVVTSLMWQTDLKALPLNITTRDLIIEPLDIGYYHAMSLGTFTAEWAGC